MTLVRVAAWADQELSVDEAVRYLLARCEQRCDKNAMGWSLLDVAAVRVLARKAQQLGFVEEE